MSIVTLHHWPQNGPVSKSETSRQAVVDAFGEADRQAKLWTPPVNPHLAERAKQLAIIDSWHTDSPADQAFVEEGKLYRLEVSPRQFQRPTGPRLFAEAYRRLKRLKIDPFEVLYATLDALKKHLGEPFLDEFAPKARTGRRSYTPVAKAAPMLQKAA